MEDIFGLVIQLVIGALGGNIIGSLFKKISLGFLGNTLAGLVGGGLGATMLGLVGIGVPAVDPSNLTTILPAIGAGASGGGIVMVIVGFIKSMLNK